MINERTPRRRDVRFLSVLIAVGGLLTLALSPALARSDSHFLGAARHDGTALHWAFLTRQQATLDAEVADEVDETEGDQGEADEDVQGDDAQGDDAAENDQGDDSQGDTAPTKPKTHKDESVNQNVGDQADENDGDDADENDGDDADENDSGEHDGGDGEHDGGGDGEHDD